jgi:CRP-like cAMP-binding protein
MSPVLCGMISLRHVRGLLEARPERWKHMIPLSLEYGDTTATIAADLLIPNAEARLVAVLLRFAGLRRRGSLVTAPITVPVTQQDLAAATNLSRAWTGRILRRLTAVGLVETRYSGITIRDPQALQSHLQTMET